MSRFITTLIRLFIMLLLLAGLIAIWEQIRGSSALSRFRRDDSTVQHAVLREVTALGKLELVRYTFKDIVEHEQLNTFLPNANAILIVEGEATGCIDLTKIALADITTRSDSLTIRLPKPELCSWKINHDRSRVYDTRFSFLDDSQLVSDAYRQAERQIRQSALNGGILEQTRQNADRMLRPLLTRLSGQRVGVTFEK
ncbi:DUF4230 domain-containing protein [Spirosoma utsteinense]|uniref:DUF4230 domain-containing protein n=1 Tax=Spirosoma utsteinense TaxID=2585773 RepID=A0ABR6WB61_9BACT|nr:DUF4230 domain-containing protein [Spirosoma utsteinense]MBC3786473.1 hypothetical protein [Spirosoma utsteinense]MBC3793814.1 hypothetical protein [Spirosoma utsteinense]